MDNDNQYPIKIRFHYVMEKSAKLQTVHGIWGGINPRGDVEICFYVEGEDPPEWTERIVTSEVSMSEEYMPDNDNVRHLTRYIHTRLLMDADTARYVIEWLEDRLEDLESGNGDMPNFGSDISQ